MKKWTRTVAAVTLTAAMLFTALGSAGAANSLRPGFDQKKVGGKVVLTTFADAVRLTPLTTNDQASNDVQGMIFEAMVATDFNGQPIPGLAERWTFDAKSLTYTFFIRKGVKFHDGKPMTTKDIKFSYDMYMDPKSVNSYKAEFESIKKITVVDDYTIKFELNRNDAFFLTDAANDAGVLPKHQFTNGIKDYNDNNQIHRNPIGTGPFKFKQWKADERIVLVANTDYWQGRPYLDEVITRIVPDNNVEVINLLNGSVDFVERLDAKSISQVNKDSDLKTLVYDEGRFDFIGLNNQNPLFKDVKLRKALALGLDRQSIVDKIFLGRAYLASGPMHPNLPQENKSVKPYPYDVAAANKLLDEAGWKMGSDGIREKDGKKLEIEVAYNNGNTIRGKIAQLAQQNWKKLGIKVTPRSYEWSLYIDNMDKGKLDMWVLAWGGYDGMVNHNTFFHSSQVTKDDGGGGNNSLRVQDATVDKLLDQYNVEADPQKRIKIYQELHKYIADQEFAIFTHHPKQTAGMNKNLMGVKISMASAFFNIQDWYWKKTSSGR